MFDLDRFKDAQKRGGFATALAEMRAGRKRGHWIWYVFPQLKGLGMSATAAAYGLDGEAEATAYLQAPVLRERLLSVASAALQHLRGASPLALTTLMGSDVDALKLVSSMTLFEPVAAKLHAAEGLADYAMMAHAAREILAVAATQGYPPCRLTRARLGSATG